MANNEELIASVNEVENSEKNPNSPKKKNGKIRYILNIAFVLIATACAILFTIWGKTEAIFNNLLSADWRWLLATFGIMLLATLIRTLILFCFARLYTRQYHFHQALAVDEIGIFYSAVTPGASGGQVLQAYTFKKQGIAISSAVSMLAMYSIMYQIVLIIFGLVALIVKNELITSIGYFNITLGSFSVDLPIWPLTIIGFLLNVFVILGVLLMGYWKKFHNFVMGPVISLGAKLHIVKNPDKSRESLRIQVENFKVELRRMFSNIPFTILVFIFFVIFFFCMFSIPYFVGQSLGNESTCANLWDAIFLSNYHQMVTGLIPLPGGSIAAETFFKLLFLNNINPTAANSFFYASPDWVGVQKYAQELWVAGDVKTWSDAITLATAQITKRNSDNLASTALLMWRSITFIFPVMIAGFVAAFYRSSPKKEMQEAIENRHTFVDLQQETYAERSADLETLLETNRLTHEAIMRKLRGEGRKKPERRRRKVQVTVNENKTTYDSVEIDNEDDSI